MHLAAKSGQTKMIEAINSNHAVIFKNTGKSLNDVWKSFSSKTGLNVLHISAKTGKVMMCLCLYATV